jgi:hypothetical protein
MHDQQYDSIDQAVYDFDCIGTRIDFINLMILIALGPKLSSSN